MQIQHFFDPTSCTLSYIVWDSQTADAIVIDPVLGFDPVGLRFDEAGLDAITDFIEAKALKLHWILETHIHADHISGGHRLRHRTGANLGVGSGVCTVQKTFGTLLGLCDVVACDGSQFDGCLEHQGVIEAGSLQIEVRHTPGHTPACVCYCIRDAVFTGDALFMPDSGTGRCDFPDGSAEQLYDSIQNQLYTLPETTRVLVGHDYSPGGRQMAFETTIGASKQENKQLKAKTSRSEFVRFRTERDATLSPPKLLYQSVQINIDGGRLPPLDACGQRILRTP
jgi:glyoxylase-like metal-dependent hydrolase (beta-lactamase superfamily II)